MSETQRCPDPEVLAAFAEGKLARREMPAIFAHLETCASCRSALATANQTISARRPFRLTGWLAAAAVIAVALLLLPRVVPSSPVKRLAELAPRNARVVEARLSGGIPWATYRGPARNAGAAGDPDRLKLGGAVGEIVERANREPSASAQHAAGVGLVLIEMPLDAIERLRSATQLAPNDAAAWSDLAAAQYAAALRLDRASLYPEALASADRSLRLDPDLPEALFNRALVLEKLGLAAQAREAWTRYLAVDTSSPWAVEARERLARLPSSTSEERFKTDLRRLEKLAVAGDTSAVQTIVDQYRQQSRSTAEVSTLGDWARAHQRGDAAEAARLLAVAGRIGDALQRASGESLLRDAVSAVENAGAANRAALAEAHVVYLRGRLAYSRRQPAAAEPDLRRAASLFGAAGDPMALVARYYAACTRYDQNDVASARAELSALLREADRYAHYIALGAQVRWQLALCAMVDDDWQGALPLLTESRAGFARLGERSNGGFLDALLAGALVVGGRPDEGWSARIRSFHALSAEGQSGRLPASLSETATMELRAGRAEVARSILEIEESVNRAAEDDVLLAYALVRGAVLSVHLGDTNAAALKANEAAATAQRIRDPALRARALADADFAAGAATLNAEPLTRAIDGYRAIERPFFLPEALLFRARAALRRGAAGEAMQDVRSGIAELERHRVRFAESVIGRSIFDTGTELFQMAVRLCLDRGDVAGAFSYAERARAHIVSPGEPPSPVSAGELQQRLAGSDAAVLELVVLPEEVLTFCITSEQVSVARRAVERVRLTELASRSANVEDVAAARELYDLLIQPAEAAIGTARQLIIVADLALEGVPFAGLWDASSRQRLIERIPVAVAPSASSLRGGKRRTRDQPSVVAVALPPGDREHTVALPQTIAELNDIAHLYGHAVALHENEATFAALHDRSAAADVIHIAGHTQRQGGSGEAVLVFTGARGDGTERVSWRSVAARPLPSRPVVVLAACETLRRPPSPQTFALSLGGGFLAAGATDVIGTLAPVADNDARALFANVHRHLRAGVAPAEALRRAQIAALSNETARRLPWHALAVVTNRIPHRN